jgi:hypothetical protein
MLTDTEIRKAKAGDKPRKLCDSRGLFLVITPFGAKWWRFKYRFGMKEKLISFGTYPEVSLKEARDRRDEARKLLAVNKNPSAERQAAKAAIIAAQR